MDPPSQVKELLSYPLLGCGYRMRRYVMEAQMYTNSYPKFLTVGYVDFIFDTRAEAHEFYYDQYPGMRSINRDENYISDWSPVDGLRYLVVPYTGQDTKVRTEAYPICIAALERMDREVRVKNFHPDRYRPRRVIWDMSALQQVHIYKQG